MNSRAPDAPLAREDRMINRLAYLASTRTHARPSKQAAHLALRNIAERLEQYPHLQDNEIIGELAELYRHFLPTPPRKPRSAFDWCALALPSHDDQRKTLHFVHVTAASMTASDGHRLHRAPNRDDLPLGLYDRAGVKVHELEADPRINFQRIIPADKHREPREIAVPDMTLDAQNSKFKALVTQDRDGNEYAFDRAYVLDALAMQTDPNAPVTWHVGINSTAGMVAACKLDLEGDRLAVLMPMRL